MGEEAKTDLCGPPRLLLIELAAVDRFHRATCYPYLFGMAKRAGVTARWLRFGVKASRQFEMKETGVGLLGDEAESLREVISELQPSLVIIDRQPAPSLVATIREAAPGARVALLGDGDAGGAGIDELGQDAGTWAGILGLDEDGLAEKSFFELTPDFGYEAANEDAAGMQPLPFIVLGVECTHNLPLARNPAFDGVDISGCAHTGGCSFCTTSGGNQVRFSYERAKAQLAAVAKTLPRNRGRLAIRLQGELPFRNVEEMARACNELGMKDIDLLFDARADSLLRNRGNLDSACAILLGTEIRVHLALLGVENFSRSELLRFNKGVTPTQNLDAIIALLELERDHPDVFRFREHGGISLILFTPWTTVEDLALNLRIIKECGLESFSGKALGGRLRLSPGLPITELAGRDGLIVEQASDRAFETAKRNLYGEELPWRFADPRMESLCSAILRLGDPGDLDSSDPSMMNARSLIEAGRARGMTEMDLAVRLVDRVMLDSEPQEGSGASQDAGDVLRDLEERLSSEATHRFSADEPVYDRANAAAAFLSALCKAGIKPVAKIELMLETAALATIERYSLPNPKLRKTGQGDSLVEIFFGGKSEDVERAAELTGVAMSGPSNAEYETALLEIGRLLGYPKCCVARWTLHETPRMRESYAWMHLSRRITATGKVEPGMSPWLGLLSDQYVPCSLDCAASLELLPRAREVAAGLLEPENIEQNESCMRSPWLVLLRGQCSAVELIPRSPVGERFRYEAGEVQWGGDEPELRAVIRGDEIVVEPERLLVLRQGRLLADLCARAYIWWHEDSMQTDFMSRMLKLRSLSAEAETAGKREYGHQEQDERESYEEEAHREAEADAGRQGQRVDLDPDAEEVDALDPDDGLQELRESLEAVLHRVFEDQPLEGAAPHWKVWVRSRDALALRLGGPASSILLYVADAERGGRSFFSAGKFAFTIPKDKPLDTSEKKRAMEVFASRIKRHARDHERPNG